MTTDVAGNHGTVLAVVAILAVQLMVAALLFGTLLLDRRSTDVRAADAPRQRR